MNPDTYTHPAVLAFYGGRWDGMLLESDCAPQVLLVNENGFAFEAETATRYNPEDAAKMLRYRRRSFCGRPIQYHAE